MAGRSILGIVGALRASLRSSDSLVRFGGDEFVVVFPSCDALDAGRALARTQAACAERAARESAGLRYGFSYGLATADPDVPIPADRLLALADRRMYAQRAEARQQRASAEALPLHAAAAPRSER